MRSDWENIQCRRRDGQLNYSTADSSQRHSIARHLRSGLLGARSGGVGGIEIKLQWVLDVGFGEDLDRKRAGYAAQKFSVLNRITLNMLK
jgi:hypothetical protein